MKKYDKYANIKKIIAEETEKLSHVGEYVKLSFVLRSWEDSTDWGYGIVKLIEAVPPTYKMTWDGCFRFKKGHYTVETATGARYNVEVGLVTGYCNTPEGLRHTATVDYRSSLKNRSQSFVSRYGQYVDLNGPLYLTAFDSKVKLMEALQMFQSDLKRAKSHAEWEKAQVALQKKEEQRKLEEQRKKESGIRRSDLDAMFRNLGRN